MDTVKFYSLSEERYHQLESKDSNAFYKTEECLYQGAVPLSRQTWGILEEPEPPLKTLSECTWEEIANICDAGEAKNRFNIGDTKLAYFKESENAETVYAMTMRLVDYNGCETSNGSSNAVFISDECLLNVSVYPGFCSHVDSRGLYESLRKFTSSLWSTDSLGNSGVADSILKYDKDIKISMKTEDMNIVYGTVSPSIPFLNAFKTDGTGYEYYTGKTSKDLIKYEATTSNPVNYLLLHNQSDPQEAYSEDDVILHHVDTSGVIQSSSIPRAISSAPSWFTNLRSPVLVAY